MYGHAKSGEALSFVSHWATVNFAPSPRYAKTLPRNMDASPRSTKSIELSSTRSPEEYSNEPWLIGIISQSLHYINEEVVSI